MSDEELSVIMVQLARIEKKVDDVTKTQSQHGEALAALGGDTMHTHERMRELAEDVAAKVAAIESKLARHISDTVPSPAPEGSNGAS